MKHETMVACVKCGTKRLITTRGVISEHRTRVKLAKLRLCEQCRRKAISEKNIKFDITEDNLRDLYINQQYSQRDIAEKYNINQKTVMTRLHKFDITKVPKEYITHKIPPRIILYNEYTVEGMSLRNIREKYGCCNKTIYRWLAYHKIEKRGRTDRPFTHNKKQKGSESDIVFKLDSLGYSIDVIGKHIKKTRAETKIIMEGLGLLNIKNNSDENIIKYYVDRWEGITRLQEIYHKDSITIRKILKNNGIKLRTIFEQRKLNAWKDGGINQDNVNEIIDYYKNNEVNSGQTAKKFNLFERSSNPRGCVWRFLKANGVKIRKQKGESNSRFKNGCITAEGYKNIYVNGRRIAEHRYIMENTIGRKLYSNEVVHHKNGNRLDNRLGNLELWNKNHPSGQRVSDKIKWSIEFLSEYCPQILSKSVSIKEILSKQTELFG